MNSILCYLKKAYSLFKLPSMSESMASVIIIYVFTNSVATSIWMSNSWTPFIFTTFGQSNFLVGLMAAVHGGFEFCTAMVSAHLADSVWGPSYTLRIAILIGFVTLCIVFSGIWLEKFWLLLLGQCLEGTYMGFSLTCVESVFAQCLRRGERDRLYSVKFFFEAAGPIVGRVVSITLFLSGGNKWEVRVLQWVMTVGVSLHLVSMTTFFFTFKPLPCHLDSKELHGNATDIIVLFNASEPHALCRGDGSLEIQGRDATPQDRESVYETEEPRIANGEYEEEMIHAIATAVSFNAPTPIHHCTVRGATVSQVRCCTPGLQTSLDPPGHIFLNSAQGAPDSRNGTFIAATAANTCNMSPSAEGLIQSDDQLLRVLHEDDTLAEGPKTTCAIGNVVDSAASPPKKVAYYIDVELIEAKGCRKRLLQYIPLEYYPLIIALCDVVLTIGSGMTTQYFTLFMMKLYDVTPAVMAMLDLCTSLIICCLAIVGGMVARRCGRVRALLPPKFIGSLILLWMALSRKTKYASKPLMCMAYVVRFALMNCSVGLSRALIMDLVPEEKRGRWNAVESIQSAGWSGTAFLGGFLADRWGYGTAFIFTFFFHIIACIAMLPLCVRNDSRLPILSYRDIPSEPSGNKKEVNETRASDPCCGGANGG